MATAANTTIAAGAAKRQRKSREVDTRPLLWPSVIGVIVLYIATYLGDSLADKAALIVSVLFVLVVELLNSGIEAVVDRIGDEPHKLSGRAKDMGSAAVFIALVITAVVWFAVLFE